MNNTPIHSGYVSLTATKSLVIEKGENMFEKGSGSRELLKLLIPILLLVFTAVLVTIVFVILYRGLEITEEWKIVFAQTIVIWLGLFSYNKADSYFTKETETKIESFINAGEPKGFTFEVLMSFISNLTISGLALTLAKSLVNKNIDHLALDFFVVYPLIAFAILLSLMSVINFAYHSVSKDISTKNLIFLSVPMLLISFGIPILVAMT